MVKYPLILAALLGCAGADSSDLYPRTGEEADAFEGAGFYEGDAAPDEGDQLGSVEQALIGQCACFQHFWGAADCYEDGVKTLSALFTERQWEESPLIDYNQPSVIRDEAACEGYNRLSYFSEPPGPGIRCVYERFTFSQCWDPVQGHPHP